VTGSFMDFFMPTRRDPHWETDFTVTPSPHHPIGAKGVGESPNVGGVPAFSNAVNDAFSFLGSTQSRCRTTTGATGGGEEPRSIRVTRNSSCPGLSGHPRLNERAARRTWMAGTGERKRRRPSTAMPGHDEKRNALAMKDRKEIAQALAASGYIADGSLRPRSR